MGRADLEPAKERVESLLARIEKHRAEGPWWKRDPAAVEFAFDRDWYERDQREKDLEETNSLVESMRRAEDRAELRRQAEAQRHENERIEWLNRYYGATRNHGLPVAADDAGLDKLPTSGADAEAFQFLKAWRPGDAFGFLLIGPAGCGKSFAFQALARHIMHGDRDFSENRKSLRWFPVSGGLDQLRREMNDGGELKASLFNSHYLFIDDLGAENLTEWSREQIYSALEHRLNFGLTTFISSNCTLAELKDRYHERFISRIKEMCVILQLKGSDRRTDRMKAHLQTLKTRIQGGSDV